MPASPFSYKDLVFPSAGLNRKFAIQNQQPYTTPDAVNVCVETLPDRRCRGGSRPGVTNYIDYMTAGRVNLMGHICGARYEFVPGAGNGDFEPSDAPGVNNAYLAYAYDDFTGTAINQEVWEQFGNKAFPMIDSNPPNGKYLKTGAALRKAFQYDKTKPYYIEMRISQIANKSNVGEYAIYLGLDDASPADGQGIKAVIAVTKDDFGYYARMTGYQGNRQLFSNDVDKNSGLLRIRTNGNGFVSFSFNDKVLYTINDVDNLGGRFAFAIECNADSGGVSPVDGVGISYYASIADYPPVGDTGANGHIVLNSHADIFICGAVGKLYRESPKGTLQCVNEDGIKTQQTEQFVMSQLRLTDLFVADYRSILDGRIHKASGFNAYINSNGKVTCEDISNWTSLNIVPGSDVVTLSNADNSVAVGTYLVADVANDGITLQGYFGDAGSTVFSVDVSPKIYNSDQNSYASWLATSGAVPTNCPLICLYRDRIVLAGAEDNPHLWYMSRQGDPYDWNYTADTNSEGVDYGIAVAGQNSDAGIISKPIRALIPHSDDYLVFGYDDEIWVLRGDPAANGQIDCMSREVGIVSKRAWCYGENGEIYFLSRTGIYVLPGGYNPPKQISRSSLPNELMNKTYQDNIQLVYDHMQHGVYIFIEEDKTQWFYDIEFGGFWKIEFSNGMEVSAAMSLNDYTLMGCDDGVIRKVDRECTSDNGIPFESKVLIGPFRTGSRDYSEGLIQKMALTFDGSNGARDVQVNVYTGREAEEAWYNYQIRKVSEVIFLKKPISVQLKRIRAAVAIIEISQYDLDEWWGLERIGVYTKSAGRMKEE